MIAFVKIASLSLTSIHLSVIIRDMENMTHTEHVARMKTVKQQMSVGSRVRVESGRTGTVVKQGHPHNGWKVRWDNPQFGATESWVRTANVTEVEA